jgi:MarR family transcriptional repressor of emrRAB
MHDDRRLENLLGAAALALSDLVLARVRAVAGLSASGAAALLVLADAPDLGVTELGRRVGLSQPAAARMLDTLAAAGLARRTPGPGRTVPVRLTPAGERLAGDLRAARAAALADLLADLDDAQRHQLTTLLEHLLTRLYPRIGDADLLCRLCDRPACTTTATCPVGQASRAQASRAQASRAQASRAQAGRDRVG